MTLNFESLAEHIKSHREHKNISQKSLADSLKITRSNIAHLEQGLKLPSAEILEKICTFIDLPVSYWKTFTSDKAILRANFEIILKELVGESITALNLDSTVIQNVEEQIHEIFKKVLTNEQLYNHFNSILVFYGITPVIRSFFFRYFTIGSFKKIELFKESVDKYLIEALRLFSSLKDAFNKLNSEEFENILNPLNQPDISHYSNRTVWQGIENIPESKLPLLGYIAAEKVERENKERTELIEFINEIIQRTKTEKLNLDSYSIKKKRKIDSLLRKHQSRLEHGLFSPLFTPSLDQLQKEIERLSPKDKNEIEEIKKYQGIAYKNLAQYLTADFMDVYVATSMRSDADFISVNQFVTSLFEQPEIKNFQLRYFNPTQSWIEDRVAKGLVEALMLKRSQLCIYMAQKEDTFGKDSEASVSLGQGKPVIVYVPKLKFEDLEIDTEEFGSLNKADLIEKLKKINSVSANDIDDEDDHEALHAMLLEEILKKADDQQIIKIVQKHWSDFDLYGEIDKRLFKTEEEQLKEETLLWLNQILKGSSETSNIDSNIRRTIVNTLMAVSLRFERRAKVFREVHPLALQVILSTGVLNGIIVVRSVETCAEILQNIIENSLKIELKIDENNYRLVEMKTQSTIRVISRHKLISNAFLSFY